MMFNPVGLAMPIPGLLGNLKHLRQCLPCPLPDPFGSQTADGVLDRSVSVVGKTPHPRHGSRGEVK